MRFDTSFNDFLHKPEAYVLRYDEKADTIAAESKGVITWIKTHIVRIFSNRYNLDYIVDKLRKNELSDDQCKAINGRIIRYNESHPSQIIEKIQAVAASHVTEPKPVAPQVNQPIESKAFTLPFSIEGQTVSENELKYLPELVREYLDTVKDTANPLPEKVAHFCSNPARFLKFVEQMIHSKEVKLPMHWLTKFLEAHSPKSLEKEERVHAILKSAIQKQNVIKLQFKGDFLVDTIMLFGHGTYTKEKVSPALVKAFGEVLQEVIRAQPDFTSGVTIRFGQFAECRFDTAMVRPFFDCFTNIPHLKNLDFSDVTGEFVPEDMTSLKQIIATNPELVKFSIKMQENVDAIALKSMVDEHAKK